MKKYILNFVIFLLNGFLLLSIYANIILSFPNQINEKYDWYKTCKLLLRSKSKIESDTIYFGDSVGKSLFHPDSSSNNFTSIAATTVIGHYILAEEILKTSKNFTTIIIVSVPIFIGNGLDQPGTYGYFIKPFFTFSNLKYMNFTIICNLLKHPISIFSIFNAFKILPMDDIDFSKIIAPQRKLSNASIIYLKKMKRLCDKNNIKLILAPPPIKKEFVEKTSNWITYRKQIEDNELKEIFGEYFDNILYLDDSCFIDNCHYKWSYLQTNNNRAAMRKMILNQVK